MGDEFQLGSGSWWDNNNNNTSRTTTASISTTLNTIASFGSPWPSENMAPDTNKSSSTSVSGGGGAHDQSDGAVLSDQNLHMMELGLSSPNLDWNQALFRGEKVETSFRSLLQEDHMSSNTTDFQQKLYSGPSSDDSSLNDFKQINRPGFSLDQPAPFNTQSSSNDSTITSQTGFHVDSYGLLLSDQNQPSTYQNRPMNYNTYSPSGGYGANVAEFMPSANKYPQFLRTSQPTPAAAAGGSHLHFTNNTPFWNAAGPSPAAVTDGRSGFFAAGLQTHHQISMPPSFDEKLKTTSDGRDMNITTKKNNTETSNKRPRNETATPLPAFKVRKEKMGDRITALQQLVSPFGKTDTASVLSEAIAYIKFLHEQVSVLSNPYMKNGAPIQHQQNADKSSNDPEGPRQDLRSRGLCLVPVSSTFPMTHETAVDFWTPTFGGTFR